MLLAQPEVLTQFHGPEMKPSAAGPQPARPFDMGCGAELCKIRRYAETSQSL